MILIPTNGGAILGAIVDHGTANTGQMQSILGGVNDVGSMFISVDSDSELSGTADKWLNNFKSPVQYIGIYDDAHSKINIIK